MVMRHRGVTEALLDDLDVGALSQQQRGVGVAQVVEAKGVAVAGLEGAKGAAEVRGRPRPAKRGGKDQVLVCEGRPQRQLEPRLVAVVGAQGLHGDLRQGHGAPAARGLGGLEGHSGPGLLECAVDRQGAPSLSRGRSSARPTARRGAGRWSRPPGSECTGACRRRTPAARRPRRPTGRGSPGRACGRAGGGRRHWPGCAG